MPERTITYEVTVNDTVIDTMVYVVRSESEITVEEAPGDSGFGVGEYGTTSFGE